MSTPIDKYLVHTVSIIKVTLSKGSRSTTTVENVPARITSRTRVVRDVGGDRLVSATIVWFKPTQDITENDEVIVDGRTRPVVDIIRARGKVGIHHLEVELG